MPCPLFEPRAPVPEALESLTRLPLIYEFDGFCHACQQIPAAAHRFRFCNHGNARAHCTSFPAQLAFSTVRFDVTDRTPQTLNVLVVEEENHWPHAWLQFAFIIAEQRLEPEIDDIPRRAQVFHFCRSYLAKFPCQ